MTNKELFVLIFNITTLVIVNIMMTQRKGTLYTSKSLWLYFAGVKATIVLPAILTALQMYVFAFAYVAKVGSAMHYLILYFYIGYLILGGFVLFMSENQVNLLRVMSVIIFLYQCCMAYQIINNQEVIKILMDRDMNLFRYGDTWGYFFALLGPILSFGGVLTSWHYWHSNAQEDFTN